MQERTMIAVTEIINADKSIQKDILHSISFLKRNENVQPSADKTNATIAAGTARKVICVTLTDTDTAIMPITATANVIIAHTSVITGMIFFTHTVYHIPRQKSKVINKYKWTIRVDKQIVS